MTKQELLVRIEPLFFENALSDVSMDDVAKRLNIKKASLYYHFVSKEAMFLELLDASFVKYQTAFAEILRQNVQNPKKLLDELVFFPSTSQNLFAVVSQRGYCKMELLKERIFEYCNDIITNFGLFLAENYNLSAKRSVLLYTVVDGLSKRLCLSGCDKKTLEPLLQETANLFFNV